MTNEMIHPVMGIAAEYVNIRARITTEKGESGFEDIEDMARELAISLIVDAGYDSQDLDTFGSPMGDAVQTALMCAFMRQPDMVDRLIALGILRISE